MADIEEQRRCDTASIGADRLLVGESKSDGTTDEIEITEADERQLVARLDRRGLWILVCCYTFALLVR